MTMFILNNNLLQINSHANLLPSLQLQVPTDSASISCTIVIIFGGVDSNPVIELYNLPDLQHNY